MSHFSAPTYHPETGEVQMANWMDDYFGRHRYGVRFPDGQVFNPETTDIKRYEPPTQEQRESHLAKWMEIPEVRAAITKPNPKRIKDDSRA